MAQDKQVQTSSLCCIVFFVFLIGFIVTSTGSYPQHTQDVWKAGMKYSGIVWASWTGFLCLCLCCGLAMFVGVDQSNSPSAQDFASPV